MRGSWSVHAGPGACPSAGAIAGRAGPGGLAYAFEPMVMEQLRTGRLKRVLEPYGPSVPGFFLYFPSQARRSTPLRLFVDAAKELAVRGAPAAAAKST